MRLLHPGIRSTVIVASVITTSKHTVTVITVNALTTSGHTTNGDRYFEILQINFAPYIYLSKC